MTEADQIYNFLKRKKKASTKDDINAAFLHLPNIEWVLTSSPSQFWISKQTYSDWEVRAKVNVKLCFLYQQSNCNIGNCGMLHLCKDFLIHNKACTSRNCKNGFSHDMKDEHNKRILVSTGINNINILRSSFPRLCKDFTTNGKCNRFFCGYLHICPDYVLGKCIGQCVFDLGEKKSYLHNFGNEHNKLVLNNFDLSFSTHDRQLLLANILTKSDDNDSLSLSTIATDSLSDCSVLSQKKPSKLTIILCKYYLGGQCQKTNCPRLHFCKDFLLNGNKCNGDECKYGFSHDPLDENNEKIMAKRNVDHLSSPQLVEILRRSFPRICKFYQEREGICGKKNCDRIHICQDYAGGKCSEQMCLKSHDLKDTHNLDVLTLFSLDKIRGNKNTTTEAFLWSNILMSNCLNEYSFKRFGKRKSESRLACNGDNVNYGLQTLGRATRTSKTTVSVSTLRTDVRNGHDGHNVNHGLGKVSGVSVKPIVPIPVARTDFRHDDGHNVKHGLPLSGQVTQVSYPVKPTVPIPVSRTGVDDLIGCPNLTEPTEKDIIYGIIEKARCTSFSSQLLCLRGYFGEIKSAEDWLDKHRDAFRVTHKSSRLGSNKYQICVEEIRPCPYYWCKMENSSCIESYCDMFHVCHDFLFHETHNKRTCKFNHSLQDSHNRKVFSKLQFTRLSGDHVIDLLKVRYPFVCMDYNDGKCLLNDQTCAKLHICYDYLNGNCKKVGSICRFRHESALNGQKALEMMESYHIKPEEFRSCIILPKRKLNANAIFKVANTDNFDPWKQEAICHNYISGECEDATSCPLLHPKGKLPYLWQYNRLHDECWNDFPSSLNMNMEKEFCKPANDTWSSDLGVSSSSFSKFGELYSNSYKVNVQIRRLSTVSSVKEPVDDQGIGLTDWCWYWEKGGSDWTEYGQWTTSQEIEKAFLNGESSFKFKTGEYNYIISFDKMEQQNQDPQYMTKRKVRRRPIFKSIADMKRYKYVSGLETPSHWPESHKTGEKINLITIKYQKLKKDFEGSINRNVLVLDVKEICNKELYGCYERKKAILLEKLGDVNEKFLYHGTDYTVVDPICVQNFDWRLCGKNATAFGHGSYFSTSASYSHGYTTADSNNVRYMFVASVLAGRFTVGNSTLKRPPQINASTHELYDSCVNNVDNPLMYIIFERDQCYPRYLIKYKEMDHVTSADYRVASTTSNWSSSGGGVQNPVTQQYQPSYRAQSVNPTATSNSSSSGGGVRNPANRQYSSSYTAQSVNPTSTSTFGANATTGSQSPRKNSCIIS